MMDALHREHEFSDLFVVYLLARNIRYEEDLVDQLFNSSKKEAGPDPLASRSFWQGRDIPRLVVPKISQEMLARNDRHNPAPGLQTLADENHQQGRKKTRSLDRLKREDRPPGLTGNTALLKHVQSRSL
jgi:hypothetical protein